MENKWNYGAPPHDELVEVELDDKIIKARAIHGGNGYIPHWQNENGSISWSVQQFNRWRNLA
tara:strand:+ start:391 stop:576 length:186 start_codon:yes stop_codon:yes gene_type:complete